MRLLSRLEYERSFDARWGTYFVRIPYSWVARVFPSLFNIKIAPLLSSDFWSTDPNAALSNVALSTDSNFAFLEWLPSGLLVIILVLINRMVA
jgi:hypothetical protein